jgi:predicted small lipoprotein YifL
MQRTTLTAVAVAVLVALAGCGMLTGDLSFSASPATVDDATLEDTGYEEANVSEQEVTREFSAAGQSRNVTVTNHVAMYERSVDVPVVGEQRAAVFGAFATPEVSVLGQSFNPVEDYSNRELAALAQDQYSGLTVGDEVGTRSVTVLGESANVTKFDGEASIGSSTVDVYVHVTKVKHDGDYVVGVAIHPQALDGEQETVDDLLAGLQH